MSDTSQPPTRGRRRDDPPRGLVPRFTPPPDPSPDQDPSPDPSPSLSPDPSPDPSPLPRPLGGLLAEPSPPPAPTGTSTTGDAAPVKPLTSAEITGLMVGVLGLVVTVAGGVIRWQTRRRLREPTKTQRREIAAPLGRILARHADLSMLGPDINDGLQAAAAAGAYFADGPLLLAPDYIADDGVPPDLNADEETES